MRTGLAAILLMTLACEKTAKDPDCESYKKAPVISVEGADSGRIKETVAFNVAFAVLSGCGQFGRFEESREGNSVNITVIARYSGCICTADIPRREAVYNFVAAKRGTYVLRFLPVLGAPLVTDTIIIE